MLFSYPPSSTGHTVTIYITITDLCLFYILDRPLFPFSRWPNTYSSLRIQIKYLFYCDTIPEPSIIDCFLFVPLYTQYSSCASYNDRENFKLWCLRPSQKICKVRNMLTVTLMCYCTFLILSRIYSGVL